MSEYCALCDSHAHPGGTYSVFRDDLGEWVAKCTDYPSLSWIDCNPVLALAGLAQLVRDEIESDE